MPSTRARLLLQPLPDINRLRWLVVDYGGLLLATLTINLLGLALPLAALQVYDRVLAQNARDSWLLLCAVVFIAAVVEATLRVARAVVTAWHGAQQEQQQLQQQCGHLLRVDPQPLLREGPAARMQVLDGLARLREFSSGQALVMLLEVPFVCVYLALMTWLGGLLVLVPVGWLLIFSGRMMGQGQQMEQALHQREMADEQRFGGLIEMLAQIHTVKALGALRLLQRGAEQRQLASSAAALATARIGNLAYQDGLLFGQLVLVSLVMAGAPLAVSGQLSLGGLMACILLGGRLMVPVQRALGFFGRLHEVRATRRRLQETLAVPTLYSGLHSTTERQGHLNLQDVSLADATRPGQQLLRNITLELLPGRAIAVHPLVPQQSALLEQDALPGTASYENTACTALLHLMAGLTKPDHGQVILDGNAPHRLASASLLRHVAYLPPLGTIYHGTIYENLSRFGQTPAEQVAEMAGLLGLSDAIARLPDGYRTRLDNTQADPLPPGMKQRLALARVLAMKPRLILFDQADRALDRAGYNLVYQLLARLKGRATLVLVSADRNLCGLADAHYAIAGGQLRSAHNQGAASAPLLPWLSQIHSQAPGASTMQAQAA